MASYRPTGAVYCGRVFSAPTSSPGTQWRSGYTFAAPIRPLRGLSPRKAGNEGSGRRSGLPGAYTPMAAWPPSPAMRPQATTCGGSRRLPADKAPQLGMSQGYCASKCTKTAENVQHVARPRWAYTYGGAWATPSGAVPGVELSGGRAQWRPGYTQGGASTLRRTRFVRPAETR